MSQYDLIQTGQQIHDQHFYPDMLDKYLSKPLSTQQATWADFAYDAPVTTRTQEGKSHNETQPL